MKVEQIKELLYKRGMRKNVVSIWPESLTASEQYQIAKQDGLWEVYYFERDNKNGIRRFLDEETACVYLLSVLDGDETVWQVSRSH